MRRPELAAYHMRPSGGIYFVPHRPDLGDDSPAVRFMRFARAIESLHSGGYAVYNTPQYDNPSTVRTIAGTAQETLSSELAKLEAELDELDELKTTRKGDTYIADLAALLDKAKLYQDLVQMKADALSERIDKATDTVKGLVSELLAAKPSDDDDGSDEPLQLQR